VSVFQEYEKHKKSLVQKSTFAVGDYRRIVIFLADGTLALSGICAEIRLLHE
jgi:hypothetical protein